MMGGSGGGFFPYGKDKLRLQQELEAQSEEQKKQLKEEVNQYLQDLLVSFNQRDTRLIQRHLDDIRSALDEKESVVKLLFGGSVAKHTYVDGLSDVDALVILDRDDLSGKSPQAVLRSFVKILRNELPMRGVSDIKRGEIAITIKYRDGSEVQLLPAIRGGSTIYIPGAKGKGWNDTNPVRFQREISKANDRLNGNLVRAMKLFKSIIAGLSKQKQLSGYHIESLCLDAAKGYRGPKTLDAVLMHVLHASQTRVLKPILDSTGQSRIIDDNLGSAGSNVRKVVADAISSVYRRLNAAANLDQWKRTLEH